MYVIDGTPRGVPDLRHPRQRSARHLAGIREYHNLPDTAAATWPQPNFSRTFDRGVAATDLRGAHRRKRNQSFGVANRQQQRNLNGEYLIGAVDCIHSHE
jgi:hypothetical protein